MQINISILSPLYSFVVFNPAAAEPVCCQDDADFCIPVIEEGDTYFQVNAATEDEAGAANLMSLASNTAQLLLLDGTGNTLANYTANTLRNITTVNNLYFEKYQTGLSKVTYLWRNILAGLSSLVPVDKCFQLGIKFIGIGEDGGDLVYFSNCFIRKAADCYSSVLEYYNEEDYAEFYYCNIPNPINRVRLPLYLTKPQMPVKKKTYRLSAGKIKRLTSEIEKEYIGETEHFPQWMHEKLIVALNHDECNIYCTMYSGSIDVSEYKIDWTDMVCRAPASFKAIAAPFSIRNSNCADCEAIIIPVVCAEVNGIDTEESWLDPNWEIAINGVNYVTTPTPGANQTIEIQYREKFSLGAYTIAGTIVCAPDGSLVSTPNPFLITGIPDSWRGVEIKTINRCNNAEFIANVDNPCETLSGLIASGIDEGATWGVEVTDVVYSLWPAFGVHKTLTVSYREYGSVGAYIAAGTIDIVVSAGFVVTMVPDPFVITGLSAAWEKVEVKVEYGDCDKEKIQVFSTPLATCTPVAEVFAGDITDTSATMSWERVIPTPTGLYDWELWNSDNTVMLDSGTGYWNPGTLILGVFGLTAATNYNFRVRCNCGEDDYSTWTLKNFTTAA
jgi:hypothetical protein